MALEIVISSDEEPASKPRTITLSDTSDDESIVPSSAVAASAPRPFAPPTRPVTLPAKAARKSAAGWSRHTRAHGSAPKHRKIPPAQRTPTTRTIVKTEQDDSAPLATLARLATLGVSRASSSDDERGPLLTEIPYPFDIEIRLEEIRLAIKEIPVFPIVKLELAFRDIARKADDATAAVFASFPLALPTGSTPNSLVEFTANNHPPCTSLLRVSRNPAIPLKPLNPFAVPAVPQPLAEILIRLTILDAGAPETPVLYRKAYGVSDGARLCRRGERAQRPTPAGSQVTIGWDITLPDSAVQRAPLSDTELAEWILRDMKRCEAEWRRETVERAVVAAEIEAQPPPSYGPPLNLALDLSAPSPVSLIPDLDAASATSAQLPLRFAPVPQYFYTDYATRGVPLFGSLLESFPQTKEWEDPNDAHNVEARVLDGLDPGSDLDEDEDEADYEGPDADDLRRAEIERRKRILVDHASFNAPDVGRTIRDFTVLKRLFAHLQVDFGELAKLQNEAQTQDNEENRYEIGHFAFERSLEEDHVVRRALRVFEEMAGRTAYRVQQEHRLIDDEEIVEERDDGEFCWMCGAFSCSVHAGTLPAYNVPTKTPFDPSSKARRGCVDCGSPDCLAHAQQEAGIGNDPLEQALRAKGMPSLDPCTASLLLRRPVDRAAFPLAPPERQSARPSISNAKKWNTVILQPTTSSGYTPCKCKNVCGDNCPCATNETYCDRWCKCPSSCPRRFRGCNDLNCAGEKSCWCRDRSRECDPQICGCSAATCRNSGARLGRQKATAVVRSQIPGGGYGAVLLEPALKDDFIGLYAGEQFPQELGNTPTMERKWGFWKQIFADSVTQSYWFDIDGGDAMDSTLLGNNVRFINHDRVRANVRSNIVNVAGTHQPAIYAREALKAGDELFLDYGPDYVESWMEGGRP